MGLVVSPGPVVGTANLVSTAVGMEYLGGGRLAAAGTELTTDTFSARDGLRISVLVPSMTAAGNLTIQFGTPTIDTAANYWFNPTTSAQVIGFATFGGSAQTSQTGLVVNMGVTGTDAALFEMHVMNRTATTKVGMWSSCVGSGSVATIPTVIMGSFEWVNTTAQITAVRLTGAQSIGAGATLLVYGRNYP